MNENPIHIELTKKETERLEKAKGHHLPIHICCVLDDHDDYTNPVVQAVRNYCIKKNVLFTSRLYDSSKYGCDREYIEQLPAFHIFMKQLYQKTYYTYGRPLQNVDDMIDLYTKTLEAKRLLKQKWRKRFIAIIKWFKTLGHRKTRMEKYNESKLATEWIESPRIPSNIPRGFTGGGENADFLPPSY